MKRLFVLIVLFIYLPLQVVCAGLFDPNPKANFKEADYLMTINRPIAADKLINDVIRFCTKKGDEQCLSEAYYYFGKLLMFRGSNIDKWYKIMSYVEQNITTDNMHQKSLDYFHKALVLAKKHEMHANISGIYIKIGIVQFIRFKDQVSACQSFDLSLENHLLFKKNNPGVNVELEDGFKSFQEYILKGKKEMGCN